jgi:hypothetical protein
MSVSHQLPLYLRVGLTAVVLASVVACASIDAQTTEYVGAPHAAATNPANVQVLRSEPTREHVRVGEVILEASTEPAPPVTELEQKLKDEAAKIGGDAVVVVYDQIQPVAAVVNGPLWNRDIETIEGRRLKGIVIHYP